MKLWTVWSDFGGTGEGRTLVARIAYAEDERGALHGFEGVFGDYEARGAECAEGVVDNNVTRALFAHETFERLRELEGRANVDLFAKFHLNFA
jgi:hypothetical protein